MGGSVEWLRPAGAKALFVFAHGAGAGMGHPFMEGVALRLAGLGIATMRYQFPYMDHGGSRPDPPAVLISTVRAAVETACRTEPRLPIVAGGKSMGGRMTSLAAAKEPLPGVLGLVFVGFPLHAAGKPSSERGAHLAGVQLPMLFLQGTRDKLAELDLLRPLCSQLAERARLHVIEEADHSFHVPKRSGRNDSDILDELAATISAWCLERGSSTAL
jgi:uncharacterized protein